MTTATEPFEKAFENFQKTASAALQMQQEMLRQWPTVWKGFTPPQSDWADQFRKMQKEWSQTMTDLLQKHRESVDKQYRTAIESLQEAFRVAESKDPEELRQRVEAFCRRTLDVMRETSESQLKEFQTAVAKWSETIAKTGKTE